MSFVVVNLNYAQAGSDGVLRSRPNAMEPDFTVKSDASETETPESVEMSFVVVNLNYAQLMQDAVLAENVKSSLKESIAATAGTGVYADHVEVILSPGSVVVNA